MFLPMSRGHPCSVDPGAAIFSGCSVQSPQCSIIFCWVRIPIISLKTRLLSSLPRVYHNQRPTNPSFVMPELKAGWLDLVSAWVFLVTCRRRPPENQKPQGWAEPGLSGQGVKGLRSAFGCGGLPWDGGHHRTQKCGSSWQFKRQKLNCLLLEAVQL